MDKDGEPTVIILETYLSASGAGSGHREDLSSIVWQYLCPRQWSHYVKMDFFLFGYLKRLVWDFCISTDLGLLVTDTFTGPLPYVFAQINLRLIALTLAGPEALWTALNICHRKETGGKGRTIERDVSQTSVSLLPMSTAFNSRDVELTARNRWSCWFCFVISSSGSNFVGNEIGSPRDRASATTLFSPGACIIPAENSAMNVR